MRAIKLLLALFVIVTPACQGVPAVQPKAKLAVEAPKDFGEVTYKLEVSLN